MLSSWETWRSFCLAKTQQTRFFCMKISSSDCWKAIEDGCLFLRFSFMVVFRNSEHFCCGWCRICHVIWMWYKTDEREKNVLYKEESRSSELLSFSTLPILLLCRLDNLYIFFHCFKFAWKTFFIFKKENNI